MHDLGRWRLSAIEQEQASLVDDLRAVFEALESGDLAYGAQAKLGGRRIRALQRRLDSLARESARVREQGASRTACAPSSPNRRRRPQPGAIATTRSARSSPTSSSVRSRAATQARRKAQRRPCAATRNTGGSRWPSIPAPTSSWKSSTQPTPRARVWRPSGSARSPARTRRRAISPPSLAKAAASARRRKPHCRRKASPTPAPRLAATPGPDRQGRARQGRIRGDAAEFLRRRDAAEGRTGRLRRGLGRRHVALDAVRTDFAADREIRRAGPQPPALRDARPRRGAPWRGDDAPPARRR